MIGLQGTSATWTFLGRSPPRIGAAGPSSAALESLRHALAAVAVGRRHAVLLTGISHGPRAGFTVSALAATLVAHARIASARRHQARLSREATERLAAPANMPEIAQDGGPAFDADRTDWFDMVPTHEELEKWVEGEKWIRVKDGKIDCWKKESDIGIYRYTDRGYESKDADGNWVSHAQVPQDVSHLTDVQIERLVKELKGGMKVSMKDGDATSDRFTPMAQVPPLEKWPFHEVAITDELKFTKDLLDDYKELEMTEDLSRAFFLGSRWKDSNEARRHLGYSVNDSIDDIANMNGSVLALKCLVEQLKRLAKFRKARPGEKEPSDASRLRALRMTGVLGTTKGSAIAMWLYNPASKRASVDIVIGDDCMDQGPVAEEALLRLIALRAAELGAGTLWCRTRRSESGRILVPKYMLKLGFTEVPMDQQEEEEWEILNRFCDKKEVEEVVPSLNLWISTRGCERHIEAVNAWCEEMGALDLNEVVEYKEDLVDHLGDALTEEERQRLLQY